MNKSTNKNEKKDNKDKENKKNEKNESKKKRKYSPTTRGDPSQKNKEFSGQEGARKKVSPGGGALRKK